MRAMRQRTPPNGWQLPIGDQILRGSTRDDLVKRIVDYKIVHGLPAGDPELDIDEFVCSAYPDYCTGGGEHVTTRRPRPPQTSDSALLERASRWLHRMEEQVPIAFVDREQAQQRADVCRACPMLVPIPGGCGECAARLRQLTKILLAGRGLERRMQASLQLCRHYSTHTALAVWTSAENAKNSTTEKPQCACWVGVAR